MFNLDYIKNQAKQLQSIGIENAKNEIIWYLEHNQIIAKKNKDLKDYQKKQKNEFVKTLNSTLANYSKEHSISMILRKEQILIGKNSLDVTKDILELFNKS